MVNINFVSKNLSAKLQATILLVSEELDNPQALQLPTSYQDLISKTLQDKKIFSGKFGQIKTLVALDSDQQLHHLIIIGTGAEAKLEKYRIEELGGKIFNAASSLKLTSAGVSVISGLGTTNIEESAALLANGALLASYHFNKYFTKEPETRFYADTIEILTNDVAKSEAVFKDLKSVTISVFLARDCISEPANILYPESYAEIIAKELEKLNVNVEIYGERDLSNFGMGAMLGVGLGSARESQLVVMNYQGASKDAPTYAVVGKGITFDSGGISLKPSNGMWEMKYDMSGSAAVLGTIKALALRKAKVNIVGVVALVENMPGGKAQRPGDVVTSMSGQTIEVQDTDAEGRLVLADALFYVQEKFKPKWIIDLATLTGAIVVALGNTYAGCFSNNDEFAKQLIQAGLEVDEKLWQMPMHKDFNDMMKSDIADMNNIGNVRGAAGSSSAACFLERFIKPDVTWAHLDIAGLAWKKTGAPTCPKGAVGFGIRLINQLIKNNYEQ